MPVLLDHPYLLPVFGGFLAGASAVLLRKAEAAFGAWLGWLSLLASAASAASFLAGFLWAATMSAAAAPSGLQIVAGFALALAGSALAGWSLRVRGVGVLRAWRADRFERAQPYRTIRRPLDLGWMVCVLGLCWLRPSPTVWVCLAAWLAMWNILLELGDWELRQRLPACRDYMKRTPRYVPRIKDLRQAVRPGL
jgi:protein-S-isoprenylcysteine O-methyltransferase Ste14